MLERAGNRNTRDQLIDRKGRQFRFFQRGKQRKAENLQQDKPTVLRSPVQLQDNPTASASSSASTRIKGMHHQVWQESEF